MEVEGSMDKAGILRLILTLTFTPLPYLPFQGIQHHQLLWQNTWIYEAGKH